MKQEFEREHNLRGSAEASLNLERTLREQLKQKHSDLLSQMEEIQIKQMEKQTSGDSSERLREDMRHLEETNDELREALANARQDTAGPNVQASRPH